MISDPCMNDVYAQLVAARFDEPKRRQITGENIPYQIDQVWHLQIPSPYQMTIWQPWIKGYHGESVAGFHAGRTWLGYIWLDQDLKEKMTGRR